MAPGRCECRSERDPSNPAKMPTWQSSTWQTTGKSPTGWHPIDAHSPFSTAKWRRQRPTSPAQNSKREIDKTSKQAAVATAKVTSFHGTAIDSEQLNAIAINVIELCDRN